MLLQEMTWPMVAALPKSTPVILPVAALEQHGHHMPLFTDSMLLGEVVRRSAEATADRALFAPLTWLGNSHHHMDFAGTMSASPRLYLDLLEDLMENMITHGFQRLLILNGHGGNIVPAQQATFELRQKYRHRNDLLILSSTYWTLGSKPWEANPALKQRQMGHACEFETSMMLRIAPQLVRNHTAVEEMSFGSGFDPAHRAWITKDRTSVGHIGNPRIATAEKGETLFQSFTTDVVKLIDRMVRWNGESWDG
ncbi:MAG: creatininase family protein [Planctomycetota bacterium]|nr:creatininase family protein [Planctomycetota bacterium]